MRPTGKARVAFVLAAAAVLGAGAWWLAADASETGEWVRVERRDLVIGVELEGELQAIESAELGPPQISTIWNYKIARLAPEGADVEAGVPVLSFDTSELEDELQQKIAERDSAEKQLEKRATELDRERRDRELELAEAQADLRRSELKLAVPEEVAKRKELEEMRIDRHLAQGRIESLERRLEHLAARRRAELASLRERRDRAAARVDEIHRQIEQMTVRAPRAGTVIYKTHRGGDKAKVGDSVWRARKVLEIPDLNRMRVEAEVAEADAGRLEIGQRARLQLDAFPDRQYGATVRRIARAVKREGRTSPKKFVEVELELDETDPERMRPGMRVRGTIESERLPGVLVVPAAAVVSTPEGSLLEVRTPFGRRQVTPRFGKRNDEHFEVEAGLDEGDEVLIADDGDSP